MTSQTLSRRRTAALATVLTIGMGFSSIAGFAVGALAPFLVADLALTRPQLGSLVSVLFAVGAVLSAAVGSLVDRSEGPGVLAAGMLVAGLALGAMALARGYSWLAVAAAVGGLALAVGNPVTNKLVALHVPPAARGLVMGIKQSGVQIGAFLAGMLLPALAGVLGWRWALGAAALAAGASGAAALMAVPPAGARTAAAPGTARLRADERIRWLVAYGFLMGAGISPIMAYLPLYAHERLAFSEQSAGAAASVVGGAAAACGILWSWSSRRFAEVSTPLALIAALGAVFVLLLAGAPAAGGWLLWTAAAGAGATAVAWNATGMLAIVSEVESERAGQASGTVVFGFYAGFVAGPPVFGWAVDRVGAYGAAWIGVAAVFAAAALVPQLRARRLW